MGLYFENTTDYDKVYENVSVVGSRCYVICSSDKVKNAVVQGFTRFAEGCANIVMFIITCDALDKRKNFTRIEFFGRA